MDLAGITAAGVSMSKRYSSADERVVEGCCTLYTGTPMPVLLVNSDDKFCRWF